MDGEQPLVITSKHTVTNTVTAPDDYLSLLKPSDKASAVRDTNTYYSTIALQKTLQEDGKTKVISTSEVATQVVITESIPPKASSVMTAYIALDVEDPSSSPMALSTTDVVKTYYVTYTYYNTINENGTPIVKTNVSTSSDVVTEKLFLHPKRTITPSKSNVVYTTPSVSDEKKKKLVMEDLKILAEKTYLTTFTYFTTLLQEKDKKTSTISHTRVVQDVVTETLQPSLLKDDFLSTLKKELEEGDDYVTKIATLQDGKQVEITAILNKDKISIQPTKVLPIEKTQSPQLITDFESTSEFSKPNVITGSTIIFFDDVPIESSTPSLTPTANSITRTPIKNNLNSLLSSEIVKKTTKNKNTASTKSKQTPKSTKKQQTISATRPTVSAVTTNKVNIDVADKKKPASKVGKPVAAVPDLLGLGSININSLQALTPVLSAMAGLIQTNLTPKSNESTTEKVRHKVVVTEERKPAASGGSHPIYIPVGEVADDFETAESQNVANAFLNNPHWDLKNKKPVESPLLNGGIPISPGEVITATSDVIVGKPGRIGPRKPTIPLTAESDNVPVGMKPPPPPPNKNWPKRHLGGGSNKHNSFSKHDKNPIIHAPNKDDYVGPPPTPPRPMRGEKHKHIPLLPPRQQQDYPQQIYAKDQTGYLHIGSPPLLLPPPLAELPNLQDEIKHNYETAFQNNYPIYAPQPPAIVYANPPIDFSLQPSIINEPIVLPEVIERSTGQPLMVNIQPSQVAFVNIPYNRTTALIYGGSTEPHKNGQYFDEPSPYPEPEQASVNHFNNRVHMSPINPNIHNGQKEVGGVIKVGPQFHNIHADVIPEAGANLPVHIRPTKPLNKNDVMLHSNINVNLPPISFEMVQQGNDFNAHIINHDSIRLQPPPLSYKVVNNTHPMVFSKRPNVTPRPTKPQRPQTQKPISHKPAPLDYLTPPLPPSSMVPPMSFPSSTTSKPRNRKTRPTTKQTTPLQYQPIKNFQHINNLFAPNNAVPIDSDRFSDFVDSDYSGEQDSFENEAGELLQGSNRRPLRPGEVPIEILRSRTTTPQPIYYKKGTNDTRHQETTSLRPVLSHPRPFEKGLVVKPENVLSNQVNPNDNPIYISYRPDPQYAPAYINNSTYSGKPTIISGIYQTTLRSNVLTTVTESSVKSNPNRPLVTSLPINSFLEHNLYENVPNYGSGGTQTEEPFGTNIKTTKAPLKFTSPDSLPNLNIGEIPMPHQINDFISDSHTSEADMEELQPPPPVIEEPSVEMQPPKLITTMKTRKPSMESEVPLRVSSTMETATVEEVLGMSPPPSVPTVPATSLPKNPPLQGTPHKSTKSASTTEGYDRFTRRKHPSTRKTTTTAAPTSISKHPFYRRPTPFANHNRKSSTTTTTTPTTSKEFEIHTITSVIENTSQVTPKPNNHKKLQTKPKGTTISPTSTRKVVTNEIINHVEGSIQEVTPVLPTRYVTHTITSTVTLTETTVITASGAPPSTMTILITKTETSTLIDTVTEFHTLLQPTSITETVTTTIQPSRIPLYPPEVPYGNIPPTHSNPGIQDSTVEITSEEEHPEDFIIVDTDPPPTQQVLHPEENESIFVVMTDKNQGSIIKMKEKEQETYEIHNRDEVVPNGEGNNVLLGGVLIASPPSLDNPEVVPTDLAEKCVPECKSTKNELCQKADGIMRCVCRPGFARMFPDRPCKRKYTIFNRISVFK